MSDTPSAFPPPPPPGAPSPTYQVAPSPLPNYQPPPMAQPPAGYPQQFQAQPWQQPQPAMPGVGAGWGAVGILAQFEPPALWAIIAGLVTIVVPFVFGRVFFFLPIIAVITGFRAIQGGKLIGGIVGIVLGIIGGIITVIGLFA
ncbi:MAG TPA: hypothetical protein VGX27_10455 [Candidatus Dormibacteraeota bacterium]|nr:hypothetical protein [Candidatus Dormibacteraeota bacterium]